MNKIGIIPSRYGSTRFEGKPLVDIHGKSMIQRVVKQSNLSNLDKTIVATDDERIFNHVNTFGAVAMTKTTHQSGTERCIEVIEQLELNPEDIIVNIQGDEPFIQPEQINLLLDFLENNEAQIATLCHQINSKEEIENPNFVKVVKNQQHKALYFSRSKIPYERTENDYSFYKHVGIYGYKVKALMQISKMNESQLEQTEQLEQLKWLDNGLDIHVLETNYRPISIDTPEDLEKVLSIKS